MKKQILALSMCFALTATATLAAGTAVAVQKTLPQSIVAPAKPTNSDMAVCPKMPSRDEIKKTMDERIAKDRESLYSYLQLTDEQKAKAEALDLKTRSGFRPLMSKVRNEKVKLDKLKKEKASALNIYKQKNSFKSAKKELRAYLDDSKKSFEAILTPEQKTKFEAMDAERRAKMKEFRKTHKHSGRHASGCMNPPSCPSDQAVTEKDAPCPCPVPAVK